MFENFQKFEVPQRKILKFEIHQKVTRWLVLFSFGRSRVTLMARVALRTLFGTAFPEAAGIGRIFRDIWNEFQDFKVRKALIFEFSMFHFARFSLN